MLTLPSSGWTLQQVRFIVEASGKQRGRMQRSNDIIALEVSAIEGQNALNSVDAHDGDEPRVIDLDALDFVVVHDTFPRGIDRRYIRQQN